MKHDYSFQRMDRAVKGNGDEALSTIIASLNKYSGDSIIGMKIEPK
jgi:hypothetical protein